MRILLALAVPLGLAFSAENALRPEERQAGWKLLFDGKTMKGWRDPAKKDPPGDSWAVEDGCLRTRLDPRIVEDLVSEESYADFELKFDWRVSPRGNTGVKYRLQRIVFVEEAKAQKADDGFEGIIFREITSPRSSRAALAPVARGFEYAVGFEFQLIDDERHPDAAKDARHTTGALYSMIAPAARAARPAGQWNQSLLVVKGDRIEHWINAVRVLEGSLASDQVRAGAHQRWGRFPAVLEMLTRPEPGGPVSLQHHGDEVWFRNLKIRRLN